MTIAFLQGMNLGILQGLKPGFAESAQLHVFQPGNGDGQEPAGLLLAGLEWSLPASSGGFPAASGSHDAVARTLLPGPGTCALQWRGAHVRIRSATLRDVGRRPGEFAGIDGSEPTEAWYASLLAQMCLAVERERQMAGHAAALHADGEHSGGSLEGLWLFVARVRSVSAGTGCWWLGATQDGRPSDMVPEELHDSLEDLVRALAGIAMTAPVAGIAHASEKPDGHASTSGSMDGSTDGSGTSQSFNPGGSPAVERLAAALDAYGPEIPQPVSVTPRAPMNGEPAFRQLSQRMARITVSAAAGCGRVGTMDCSIAPLTEPDMRTTHPALWIGPSKCQLKLGRYLRGVKFHPSGFQRYQSSCEPGNRIGPRHARTVGLVPNTPAAIRGTGGSPAARPHCQKMPEKEAGSLLLTHDDSSQPTADMSVEYTQSLDTLFRAEPEVRHPPVEVAAETRHTR